MRVFVDFEAARPIESLSTARAHMLPSFRLLNNIVLALLQRGVPTARTYPRSDVYNRHCLRHECVQLLLMLSIVILLLLKSMSHPRPLRQMMDV